jgi:hypothetical protein
MALPTELKPQGRERVIDLAERAGLDVSDWPNYERGKENPGANPKYCYEWALVEPGRLVVCNLWYGAMKEVAGGVEQHLVLRDTDEHQESDPTRRARRARMEKAIAEAFLDRLPVRVIVLDGRRRGPGPFRVQHPGKDRSIPGHVCVPARGVGSNVARVGARAPRERCCSSQQRTPTCCSMWRDEPSRQEVERLMHPCAKWAFHR